MKFKSIPYNWNNVMQPHIEDDCIVYMVLPASMILINDGIVVIDNIASHKDYCAMRELHFFIEGPMEISWDNLTDDQRFKVRTRLRDIMTSAQLATRYGEYTDDRYNILEALEVA